MNAVSERLPAAAAALPEQQGDSRLGQALARAERSGSGPLTDALSSYAKIRDRLREKRPEAALSVLEDWKRRRAAYVAGVLADAQAEGRAAHPPALNSPGFPEVGVLEQPELEAALQALAGLKRWAEPGAARKQLAGALALDLTRAEAHNTLGVLHAEMGEFEQAAKDFTAAAHADAGHYRSLTNQVALRLQQLADLPPSEQAAELAWAEAELRRSLELNGEQHAAYQNLAVVLRSRGDRAGSVAAAKKASQLDNRRSEKQGQDVAQRELKRFRGGPLWVWLVLAAAGIALYLAATGLG